MTNGTIVFGRICRLCPIVVCKRESIASLLVIDTHEFGMILEIIKWLIVERRAWSL